MENLSQLNIVRVGAHMTYSSLMEIGGKVLESFQGRIQEVEVFHHEAPLLDSIDALLLTKILHEEFRGHTLGITDADLKTNDEDEFYNSIFGGKNPKNDVAVVSTKKLIPFGIKSEDDYNLYFERILKVSLHEIGHNFGLTDHASYKPISDGTFCPMSRGEFNKFGYIGYVKAVIDSRGLNFCDECRDFLKRSRRK